MPRFVPMDAIEPGSPESAQWWRDFQAEIVLHSTITAQKLRADADTAKLLAMPSDVFDGIQRDSDGGDVSRRICCYINSEVLGNRKLVKGQLPYMLARTLEVCTAIIELNRNAEGNEA